MDNSLVVEFIPRDAGVYNSVPCPQPSKIYSPEWFKEIPNKSVGIDENLIWKTLKHCMPFMDGMFSGYTQELACDITIKNDGLDNLSYSWSGNFQPLSSREDEGKDKNFMPEALEYYHKDFHWNTFWEPKTPDGYSTLYYHPSNRFDLPFTTMSGIIDTDKWSITGPLPFLLKRGFTGLIPAGTPIYQMIFIKRDSWESIKKEYDSNFNEEMYNSIRESKGVGYKQLYWSRKEYS
jgi:hypothetical protein